jgi:Ca2+/Na+ antiporter
LSTSDYGTTVEMYLSLALCVIIALVLAFCVYILPSPILPVVRATAPDKWGDFPGNEHYHSSHMYLQRTSLYIWLFVAFCSCIMWIDLTANALVAALSLAGDTIGIPKEFLGLTVLAWGNSVGDCITNTALARQGRGLMALSGCYGGPLFNVFVGLGVSLLLNALAGEPVVFNEEQRGGMSSFLHADYAVQSLLLSIFFLYVVLMVGVSLVHCAEYQLTSRTGACLIAVYVLYSLCQCALLYRDEYQ